MKALIEAINYLETFDSRFGTKHKFEVVYDGKVATFLSNEKEQKIFKEGVENEFDETQVLMENVTVFNIKPPGKKGKSNFSKQLKREQSKYSGFAMSYAKDLVVAGMIKPKDIFTEAMKMMNWMVEQDKALENG